LLQTVAALTIYLSRAIKAQWRGKMASHIAGFASASGRNVPKTRNWHRYGAHGVLLALPMSLALWAVIGVVVL
jgi:hypothetical protein